MKRNMPGHKRRLASVVINDRKITDVFVALQAYAEERPNARTYVNSDGDLVVADDNWKI